MKRAATGGAHRGPVPATRQRRTIRLVEIVLVLLAATLFALAGYAYGLTRGIDQARSASRIDEPRRPGIDQTLVLVGLGGIALGIAFFVHGEGPPRVLTPARLGELAERAEQTAIARAEERTGGPESSAS